MSKRRRGDIYRDRHAHVTSGVSLTYWARHTHRRRHSTSDEAGVIVKHMHRVTRDMHKAETRGDRLKYAKLNALLEGYRFRLLELADKHYR